MNRPTGILLLCVLSASCRAAPVELRPALETTGGVYVYLQPSLDSADRLVVGVDSVWAVSADGGLVPLRSGVTTIDADQTSRERLLASGAVPVGRYLGVAIRFDHAALRSGEGDVALVLPRPEVRVDVPFVAGRARGTVVSLRLRGADSIDSSYRFSPQVSGALPPTLTPGLLVMATSCRDGTLTIFDKLDGHVAAVLPAGRRPGGTVLDADRLRAYVPLADEDEVRIVDLQQYRATDRVKLFGGDRPVELVLTPDRSRLLIVNAGSDTLVVIDTDTFAETARLVVGDEPSSVLVDRTGRRAYVLNGVSGSVSVIDLTGPAVVATIGIDAEPVRGQLDRLGQRLYVAHRFSPYLTVLDTTSLQIVQRVYVGSGAQSLKVDPRNDRIYLSFRDSRRVEIYDAFSLLPVDSIETLGDVVYMSIDDEGNNLVLALEDEGWVQIIRLVGKQTVALVDVAGDPCRVSLLRER